MVLLRTRGTGIPYETRTTHSPSYHLLVNPPQGSITSCASRITVASTMTAASIHCGSKCEPHPVGGQSSFPHLRTQFVVQELLDLLEHLNTHRDLYALFAFHAI